MHWKQTALDSGPSPRVGHGAADLNGRIVVFGGVVNDGLFLQDTWVGELDDDLEVLWHQTALDVGAVPHHVTAILSMRVEASSSSMAANLSQIDCSETPGSEHSQEMMSSGTKYTAILHPRHGGSILCR